MVLFLFLDDHIPRIFAIAPFPLDPSGLVLPTLLARKRIVSFQDLDGGKVPQAIHEICILPIDVRSMRLFRFVIWAFSGRQIRHALSKAFQRILFWREIGTIEQPPDVRRLFWCGSRRCDGIRIFGDGVTDGE
jgi:hypothetical protein